VATAQAAEPSHSFVAAGTDRELIGAEHDQLLQAAPREPVNGATRITMHGEAEPGAAVRLAEPIMRRAMQRQAESDLGNLRDILETR